MSWDISILDFPKEIKRFEDIPDDFRPTPIGSRDAVIFRIREVLPDVNFSDPTWGVLDQPDFSIEFNMGADEVCEDFMLHVRGGGGAIATIAMLLERLGLRGVDCQTGEIFSIDGAEGSFAKWQAYRDKVIGQKIADD